MRAIEATREKNKRPNMDCVNLLTSILLCYPEISMIAFEPHQREEKIFLSYIIEKVIKDEECKLLEDFIQDSLLSYQFLEKINSDFVEIEVEVKEKATFVNIKRDIQTFFQTEISLINNIVKEKLLKDLPPNTQERVPIVEATLTQLETIDTTLASLKLNPAKEHMIGIREDGRVIVYND